MTKYVDFFEACLAMIENGIDHSDAEQKAHYQDLYGGMTDAAIHELFERRPDFYACLAWVMGGHEVARVAAEIAREAAQTDFTARLSAMGEAHKEQIDELMAQVEKLESDIDSITCQLETEIDTHTEKVEAIEAQAVELAKVATANEHAIDKLTAEIITWQELHAQALQDLERARTEARKHRAEAERLEAGRAAAEVEELKTQIRALTAYAQSLER